MEHCSSENDGIKSINTWWPEIALLKRTDEGLTIVNVTVSEDTRTRQVHRSTMKNEECKSMIGALGTVTDLWIHVSFESTHILRTFLPQNKNWVCDRLMMVTTTKRMIKMVIIRKMMTLNHTGKFLFTQNTLSRWYQMGNCLKRAHMGTRSLSTRLQDRKRIAKAWERVWWTHGVLK